MHFNKHTENYFDLLGIKQEYSVDLDAVQKTYFALQMQFHPDRFSNSSAAERLAVAKKSTDINEAYKVISNDLYRGEYLLFLNDILVNKDSKEAVQPCMIILAEAMEMRERLLDAETMDDIKILEDENQENRNKVVNKLKNIFDNKQFEDAIQLVIKMRYIEKFVDEIRAKKLRIS